MEQMDQKKNQKGMLNKQKRFAVMLGVLAVLLAVAYGVIRMLHSGCTLELALYDEKGDLLEYSYSARGTDTVRVVSRTDTTLTLAADSEIDYTSRPYVFAEISLDSLQSISVTGASGSYELYKDKTGEYLLRGYEMLMYKSEALANLKVEARYMLATQRVDGEYTADALLAPFGLDEASAPTRVCITESTGESHTLLIGGTTVSEDSYYVMDTSKPYVYVIDSGVSVFFTDPMDFIDPVLMPTLSQSEYQYMSAFSVTKNGELFMASEIVPEERRATGSDTDLHKLTYPGGYSASLTKYYEALESLGSLKGSRVIETNVLANGEENANALFEKYGLTVASNDVSYTSGANEYRFITGDRFTDTDGAVCYYVYSPYMDYIAVLPLENAPFLEYELLDFIDASVFQVNINDISELTAHIAGVTRRYRLEGEGKELVVTDADTGEAVDTASFRQFYIALLSIKIDGYAAPGDVTGGEEFSFSYVTDYGEKASYSFSVISTTRDLISLDGSAEFYTNRSYITKASDYLLKLSMGETIAADY